MPNGDPHFDVDGIEGFFSSLRSSIEAFAERHNLRIQKYYHDSPSWDLLFRHPARGVGKIDILRRDEMHVAIQERWWFDDYDSATRSIRVRNRDPIEARPAQVTMALESSLRNILSWKFGTWDSEHSGHDNWYKTWSKAQFHELEKEYPIPIP